VSRGQKCARPARLETPRASILRCVRASAPAFGRNEGGSAAIFCAILFAARFRNIKLQISGRAVKKNTKEMFDLWGIERDIGGATTMACNT
jgi:hypothetical protein